MALTQPVLDGLTLPWPAEDGYEEIPRAAQSSEEMYDGSIKALTIGSLKKDYIIRFHGLTTTEADLIDAKLGQGAISFTDLRGTARTVIIDEPNYKNTQKYNPAASSGFVHEVILPLKET